jgi:hypothetical protein
MSDTPFNPLAGIDPHAKVLSPFEIVTVTSRIVGEATRAMSDKVDLVLEGFKRIAGDGDDPEIPVELRRKGLLCEMREERIEFQEEQRAWKLENDGQVELARLDRVDLRDLIVTNHTELETLRTKFEADQNQRYKLRRLLVWFVRWITRKDDSLSIVLGKIGVVLAFFGTAAVGGYHGIRWVAIHAWKLFHYFIYGG